MLLESYLKNNHYPSKQARVDQLDPYTIEDIVLEVIQMMPDDEGTIQEVATRLGYKLGFSNQLEAVKTGAEVLAVTQTPELLRLGIPSHKVKVLLNMMITISRRNSKGCGKSPKGTVYLSVSAAAHHIEI